MKKVTLLIIGILCVSTAIFAYVKSNQTSNEQLSVAEIREMFKCDRMTDETLATDIYCQNPSYYYEDEKNGSVISASDFRDIRYQKMFDR